MAKVKRSWIRLQSSPKAHGTNRPPRGFEECINTSHPHWNTPASIAS